MNSQSDVEERSSHPAYGSEHFDTVIIGGGQAGLSVGYHLKKQGRPFVILDANERIGDSWRKRWDSLRLFTPARYTDCGLALPRARLSFPTKDEMADYLESYAARFDLPVRTGLKVDALSRVGDRFVVASGNRRFEAERVVVATGSNQVRRFPLRRRASSEHRAAPFEPVPQPFPASGRRRSGGGCGQLRAEIAFEVSRTHPTFLSGKPSGELPVRHGPAMARFVFPVIRFVGNHVLTLRTPIGRKVQPWSSSPMARRSSA